MHCWKIINIERDFGTTRIAIMSSISFVLTFSFAYVFLSLSRATPYTDKGLWLFIGCILLVYPVHKLFHFIFLIDYYHSMKVKIRMKAHIFPLFHLKIKKIVPKYRYILSLLAPFICLNGLLLYSATWLPDYVHYISLLFGLHNLICLIDLLNVKSMIRAPHHAVIEETPKGYEVLVPLDTSK